MAPLLGRGYADLHPGVARAHVALAILRAAPAGLAVGALGAGAATAVFVGLRAVLDAVRAGGRGAFVVGAGAAGAVAGRGAALAVGALVAGAAAAVHVGLGAVLGAVHAGRGALVVRPATATLTVLRDGARRTVLGQADLLGLVAQEAQLRGALVVVGACGAVGVAAVGGVTLRQIGRLAETGLAGPVILTVSIRRAEALAGLAGKPVFAAVCAAATTCATATRGCLRCRRYVAAESAAAVLVRVYVAVRQDGYLPPRLPIPLAGEAFTPQPHLVDRIVRGDDSASADPPQPDGGGDGDAAEEGDGEGAADDAADLVHVLFSICAASQPRYKGGLP